MPAHAPPSPTFLPSKRARPNSPDKDSPSALLAAGTATSPTSQDGSKLHTDTKAGQSSNFRNVSACNRCRLRKNRCDQQLPSCASCEKANVACVGYDPITKREIPRSYVFYLETRVEQLEALLQGNDIAFPPAESLDYCARPSAESGLPSNSLKSPVEGQAPSYDNIESVHVGAQQTSEQDVARLQQLVSKSSMSRVPEAANPRYLGSASGVSFARVVFAAVQSSVSDQRSTSDKAGVKPYRPVAANGPSTSTGTSMRDSFFGLHAKPTIHPASFPEKDLGQKLVALYFEHANPQIPVLHKGAFMQMFEQAYADEGHVRGPRELYMLNMVFAIGGGIIMTETVKSESGSSASSKQCPPEEYHASAIVHLEACLSSSGGGLEELQAVLLLANFALLRPVPPGLWYIIGVAMRLAVDLGLHYEDGKDLDTGLNEMSSQSGDIHNKERGRREFIRDMRRRLWWSTYSLDRLVSVCVGRPFGVSDQVITTEFPSLLEDRYITPTGFLERTNPNEPTYKLVAHHYFRLRLLQSEILQVLQFQQAQIARMGGQNQKNRFMHTHLPSPFLSKFDSFRMWRIDIDRRLYEWKGASPKRSDTGVAFSTEFLELNYWQAIIMLYRQSLSVPAMFEGEYHTSDEVNSPSLYPRELREDEERVYLKVAEAGQKILRLYRQLHIVGLVNYTYLATHHLFMAGISYLYAIWHSPIVRSRLTMDEVDFTVLAANSVFGDLMDKCPPAEACKDAFDRTAKATIKMANSTGGFGQSVSSQRSTSRDSFEQRFEWSSRRSENTSASSRERMQRHMQPLEQAQDSYFDTAPSSYTHSSSSSIQIPTTQELYGRLSSMAPPKTEPENNVLSPDGMIDPSFVPSPPVANSSTSPGGTISSPLAGSAQQLGGMQRPTTSSPVSSTRLSTFMSQAQQQQQQRAQQQAFSSAPMDLGDLQGIDFLQTVNSGGNMGGPDGDFGGDGQMDLGFGLGWEGTHHDFSDGQQVDLFDGFFFGGQQGMGSNGF